MSEWNPVIAEIRILGVFLIVIGGAFGWLAWVKLTDKLDAILAELRRMNSERGD